MQKRRNSKVGTVNEITHEHSAEQNKMVRAARRLCRICIDGDHCSPQTFAAASVVVDDRIILLGLGFRPRSREDAGSAASGMEVYGSFPVRAGWRHEGSG